MFTLFIIKFNDANVELINTNISKASPLFYNIVLSIRNFVLSLIGEITASTQDQGVDKIEHKIAFGPPCRTAKACKKRCLRVHNIGEANCYRGVCYCFIQPRNLSRKNYYAF